MTVSLRPLDLDTWPRRGLFEHYWNRSPCTSAMTVELDVTRLRPALAEAGARTYPAHVWALATVVARHPELRMGMTSDGHPAVWDRLDPMFTIFHPERETFSAVWVPYDEDFAAFQRAALRALDQYRDSADLFPQEHIPPHVFDVSAIPWTTFTGFTLGIENGTRHLAPIFTLGRHVERDARTLLPLAVQVHHAAADGFHTARLVRELQQLFDDPVWLNPAPAPQVLS